MGSLIRAGKVRAWGLCNDDAYGLTRAWAAARAVGAPPPAVCQNDFSLLDRRVEENGLTGAMARSELNVGFLGYDALAGGFLADKYRAPRDTDSRAAAPPRGRHDTAEWGPYLARYRSEPATRAAERYAALARGAGMPQAELALRWARQRRGLTAALVGCSSLAQLEEVLRERL